MTITNVTSGQTITAAKTNEIIDQLNGMVAGSASVSFTSGTGSLTFGATFASAPILNVSLVFAATSQFTIYIQSITTTGATLTMRDASAGYTGTRTIHWIAVGTLA